MKKLVLLAALASIPVIIAFGQAEAGRESRIDESYLQESIENTVIREHARVNNRDQKFIALGLIGAAMESGNTGGEIHSVLEFLALEGILNRLYAGGRIANDFPDVRREAARRLGALGTLEARNILLTMVYHETETTALQEAVKSLGDIQSEDNRRTVNTIAWVFQKFHNTVPDNLLAFSVLETIEKLGAADNRDSVAMLILIPIIEGPYVQVVRNRAASLLESFRRL